MREFKEERIFAEANYIVDNRATIRETAEHFMVGRSTVHADMQKRLPICDVKLSKKVREVLDYNLSVRHLRGGEKTRERWLEKDKD